MFLAWMMIFAHGLIPHSHYDEIPFHHGLHDKGCVEESSITSGSCSEDEEGCRISNLLFHKFSQDDQQTVLNSSFASYFFLSSGPVIFNSHYSFLSGRYSDTESLRAPPCA